MLSCNERCVHLSALNDAHGCDSEILIGQHSIGARNPDLDLNMLTDGALGGSCVTVRLTKQSKHGRVEFASLRTKTAHLARKQVRPKTEKRGTELLVEGTAVKSDDRKTHHAQKNCLVYRATPHASHDRVASCT